ncbi:MAG: glycosyltransferase family 4 protein [bacterium]
MMLYVLHAMGMESSKYGGLERFMIHLAENLKNENMGLIIIYNTTPWSEEYIKDLRQAGVLLVISHAMKPVSYMKTLFSIFRQYKPVIVHTHFQDYFSIFFSRLFGCKHVFSSIHNMLIDNNLRYIENLGELTLRKRLQKYWVFNLTSRVFPVSDAVRIQYVSLFPRIKKKIITFYLGVLPNNNLPTASRKALNIPDDQILIGTIGFNSRVKGLDVLFEALSILKHNHKFEDFILIQIGIDISDSINQKFINDAKEKSIDGNIKWMGIRNNVNEFLPGLDIYCQPSRSEALGLSVLEAGMAGLPVVGSKVGGIPEIVKDGENGFLFESENAGGLAGKLFKLAKDSELRKIMGDRMKKSVIERFNINTQAKELTEIYKNQILKGL